MECFRDDQHQITFSEPLVFCGRVKYLGDGDDLAVGSVSAHAEIKIGVVRASEIGWRGTGMAWVLGGAS